ncbi:hypothetical protein [Microtetraspora malaysiensis]|uniref:hypothetical protein n=1 Tax=Microtetraspora malaysiensis TaxID=161358 RepID=UPI003D8BE270
MELNLDLNLLIEVAGSVGRNVARNWPMMEAEDITQHVLTCVWERPREYEGLEGGALYASLKRDAVAWCVKERADYVTSTARYVYTPAEVRELVAILGEGNGSQWSNPPTRDGYVAAPDAGNIAVSVWDLDQALAELPTPYAEAIARKCVGDNLSESDRRTYYRAVDRLTAVLNRVVNRSTREHDGPGSRRAMSNARAAAITHDQWGG